MHKLARVLLFAVLLAALAITLRVNLHTARALAGFQTNALWRDQWWFLGEWQGIGQGKNWLDVLWQPYWGHRPVVPRLLYFADAQLFSYRNAPLLVLGWTALLAQTALALSVNRSLFGSVRCWQFIAGAIVTLNLYWSSFQMENLIWALQAQYLVLNFCAVFSFFAFARSREGRVGLWLAASCAGALVGSLTMAHGLAIWPALACQALLCRSKPRVWMGFAATFVICGAVYSVGYWAPDLGMGLRGQLRRPGRAMEVMLIVIGGPLSNERVGWGIAAGACAVVGGLLFAVAIYRDRTPAWPSVHFAIALFIGLTAVFTAAGRMSPEMVKQQIANHGEIVTGRYLTFALIEWTSLFALSLWAAQRWRAWALRAVAIAVCLTPCYFVFGYARLQPIVADAWVDGMRGFDVTASSLLVGADDWERQQLLWSGRAELETWTTFARSRKLSVFSEARYAWLGRPLEDVFRLRVGGGCEGKVESLEPLAGNAWRVNGWAWDNGVRGPALDIVLVDGARRIRGLGRTGVPHHDTGGHSAEVFIYRAGYGAYFKGDLPLQAYAVIGAGGSACLLTDDTLHR